MDGGYRPLFLPSGCWVLCVAELRLPISFVMTCLR